MTTTLKLALILTLALGLIPGIYAPLQAQTTAPPDCLFFVNLTLTGGSGSTVDLPTATGFDNRTLGCQTWTFFYTATATSGSLTNIDFQSAGGALIAGSFGDNLTVLTGANPNTSSVTGTTTLDTGCANGSACNVPNAWIRLVITRNSFVGAVRGVVMGYRSGYPGGGGGGSSGPATNVNLADVAGNPTRTGGETGLLAVGGPDADGAIQNGNPVLTGGFSTGDSHVHMIQTDTSGNLVPAAIGITMADAVSNTQVIPNAGGSAEGLRIFPQYFNGATWDRQFRCNLSTAFTVAPGTDVVIAAGVASTNTRLCHIDFASDTVAAYTIRQGTGTTCLTNTASLAGPYSQVASIVMDYQPTAPLVTTVQARDVCIHSSASATFGGVAIYAQY